MESPPKQIQRARNAALLGNNSNEVTGTTQGPKAYIRAIFRYNGCRPDCSVYDQATDGENDRTYPETDAGSCQKLEFIEAAQYRDELLKLEDMMKERWG